MIAFLSTNWIWILLIGAMLFMHLGHGGHRSHGAAGGGKDSVGGCGGGHGGHGEHPGDAQAGSTDHAERGHTPDHDHTTPPPR